MFICLQRIFSFCETAELKNKMHAFDSAWLWNVRKISQPLQNEIYSDVSKFHCQEGGVGGNVMIHKPYMTFHRNTEWIKMAATPHY